MDHLARGAGDARQSGRRVQCTGQPDVQTAPHGTQGGGPNLLHELTAARSRRCGACAPRSHSSISSATVRLEQTHTPPPIHRYAAFASSTRWSHVAAVDGASTCRRARMGTRRASITVLIALRCPTRSTTCSAACATRWHSRVKAATRPTSSVPTTPSTARTRAPRGLWRSSAPF